MFLIEYLVKVKWAKNEAMALKYIEDRHIMCNSGWCDKWTCVSHGQYVWFELLGEGRWVKDYELS